MDMAQILLLVLAVPAAYLLLFLLLRLEDRLPAGAAGGKHAEHTGQRRDS